MSNDPFGTFFDSLTLGVAKAVERTKVQVEGFVGDLAARARSGLEEANIEIAEKARKAILDAYDARPASAVSNIAYRTRTTNPANMRYAGGRLRRAIASPDFYEVTPTSIGFVNVDRLDKEARHWHRLAFGAAPEGQGSAPPVPVMWQGMVAATLGYEEGPSPAFTIPVGYFVAPGAHPSDVQQAGAPGTGIFYPKGAAPITVRGRPTIARTEPTRGIAARGFLDVGLVAMAEEMPLAYSRLFDHAWAEAQGA